MADTTLTPDSPASVDWLDAASINAFGTCALHQRMGIVVTEASRALVVGTMPVEGNTQPFGFWHGGASCVLAETLASVAGFAAVGPDGAAFGVDINATHHRPARDGTVTGTATAVYLGGRLATYEVVLVNDAGDRLCTARVTVALQRGRQG